MVFLVELLKEELNRKTMYKNNKKLLLVGPKYHNDGRLGGVVVLFELFLKELENRNIPYVIIDSNKSNYKNKIFAMVYIYINFLWNLPRVSHISLHGTAKDFIYIAPFFTFVSKLFRKRLSLRKFAGNFREIYLNSNCISKILIRYSLINSTYLFFETKYLVQFFSKFNQKTYWLPNCRKKSRVKKKGSFFNRSYIFLGHVKKEKGIIELISASNILGKDYKIDIYGTVNEKLHIMIDKSNASYKGTINPENVSQVISNYDVLVLPTYWSGEGYPGVIIEAFSVGIPVIASALDGIKEIVEHERNGLLIKPKDVSALVDAIKHFNERNYYYYSSEASKSFQQFDIKKVNKKFLERIGYGDKS